MSRLQLIINKEEVTCPTSTNPIVGKFEFNKHTQIEDLAKYLQEHETAITEEDLKKLEENIKSLGKLMFSALLNGPIREHFFESYKDVAKNPKEALRLELCFSDPKSEEASWPWEFLCIDEIAAPRNIQILEPFLAISPKVALVRNVVNVPERNTTQLKIGEELRIGLAVSKPRQWGELAELGDIDDQPTLELLDNLSQNDTNRPIGIKSIVQNPATHDTITKLLENHSPHIFHYVGHGDLQEDIPVLLLIDDQGKDFEAFHTAEAVEANKIVSLFTEHCPAVVILQSCNTAKTGDRSSHASMAAQLAQAGVPLVVAMQYEIQNDVANAFIGELYSQLAAWTSIEKAVNAARQYLYHNYKTTRNFGTPVIYVTTPTSELFPGTKDQIEIYQLANEFLEIPHLETISTDIVNTVGEQLLSNGEITFLSPPDAEDANLAGWIYHLIEANPINDKPLPLAHFVATLADRLAKDNQPLCTELENWIRKNKEKLEMGSSNWEALILAEPVESNPPCLQLIIEESIKNQPGKKEKFELVARDGRDDVELKRPKGSPTELTREELLTSVRQYISMIYDRLKPSEYHLKWEDLLWIEFCLPDALLSRKFEQWTEKKGAEETIGESYKVVVRSLYRWRERYQLRDTWPHKWKACEDAMNHHTKVEGAILTSAMYKPKDLEEKFKAAQVLGLTFDPTQTKLFRNLLDSGIPVILWSRDSANIQAVENWLKEKITSNESPNLLRLAELVRDERKSQTPLSKSLVLLWDNFNRKLQTDEEFIEPPEAEDDVAW